VSIDEDKLRFRTVQRYEPLIPAGKISRYCITGRDLPGSSLQKETEFDGKYLKHSNVHCRQPDMKQIEPGKKAHIVLLRNFLRVQREKKEEILNQAPLRKIHQQGHQRLIEKHEKWRQ